MLNFLLLEKIAFILKPDVGKDCNLIVIFGYAGDIEEGSSD